MVTEETVLAFVRHSLRSAWALEMLLLLQRNPAKEWSANALVRELRGSANLVSDSLAMLSRAGLIAASESSEYRYHPQSAELAELVTALVTLHAAKPIAVLKTIYTSPDDKIRSFSDAFLFKK